MDLRFTATAILALHQASEYFLMEVMEKTHLAALHCKRIMIAPKDMHLVKAITHMWSFRNKADKGKVVFCY